MYGKDPHVTAPAAAFGFRLPEEPDNSMDTIVRQNIFLSAIQVTLTLTSIPVRSRCPTMRRDWLL